MATRRRIRLGGIISATAKQVADAAKAAADALKAQQQIDQQAKADRDAAIAREAETQRQAAEDRAKAARDLAAQAAEAEADRIRLEGELARQKEAAAAADQARLTKDQSQDQAISAEAVARKDADLAETTARNLALATLRSGLLESIAATQALIPPRGVQVVAVGSAAIPPILLGATVDVTLTLSETMADTAYKVSILRPAALLSTGTTVTIKSQTTTAVVLTIKAGLALATGNSVSVVVTR